MSSEEQKKQMGEFHRMGDETHVKEICRIEGLAGRNGAKGLLRLNILRDPLDSDNAVLGERGSRVFHAFHENIAILNNRRWESSGDVSGGMSRDEPIGS